MGLLESAGWIPKEVDTLEGVRELYHHDEPRFRGVFSKLHIMSLVEYDKVLLLDIDTLAVQSMDNLFKLEAPAATGRGPQDQYKHGDSIDGSCFFKGSLRNNPCSWQQAWGINAGVMLLRPDRRELDQMTFEVLDSKHPSHIAGKGPEQDYLSRYYADSWTHIGVEYNFQLHQMYHVVTELGCYHDARPRLMRQFLADPGRSGTDVRLVHY